MKIQFIGISLTALVEIYIYTWPADHMKDMVNYVLLLIYKYIIICVFSEVMIVSFIFVRV